MVVVVVVVVVLVVVVVPTPWLHQSHMADESVQSSPQKGVVVGLTLTLKINNNPTERMK